MNQLQNHNTLVIAGEKSGEDHFLSFYPELKALVPHTHFWGVGGEAMEKEGVEILYKTKDFSAWGISGVVSKIPFYLKIIQYILEQVVQRQTKTCILIDFQTFNLILAKKLFKKKVKVLYYVAPQAWAWKAWRAKVLAEVCHILFPIIPFEKEWFESRGVKQVHLAPHPVWIKYKDHLADLGESLYRRKKIWPKETLHLLILPGSRNFEVQSLLKDFINISVRLKAFFKLSLRLVKTETVHPHHYEPFLSYFDRVYDSEEISQAFLESDLCLSASGTVTLTAALFKTPTIVCYKSSLLNEWIYYNFISYRGPISLANIFLNERVFPEFIQNEIDEVSLAKLILSWLQSKEKYEEIIAKLTRLEEILKNQISSVAQPMAKVISHE